MTVRKLYGVETDQDSFTQAAQGRDSTKWLYARCMGYRRTKMAVRKLHGVETDHGDCTQSLHGRDGPRWLYASCRG
jgi:hypothetical protein